MPIRPIDLQVAIPKMSQIARIKHLEQQKPGMQQQQNAGTTNRSIKREHETVVNTKKDGKADTEADAKKKGRNKYEPKKTLNKKETEETKKTDHSQHIIDIRI